jgi:hypothetical protein
MCRMGRGRIDERKPRLEDSTRTTSTELACTRANRHRVDVRYPDFEGGRLRVSTRSVGPMANRHGMHVAGTVGFRRRGQECSSPRGEEDQPWWHRLVVGDARGHRLVTANAPAASRRDTSWNWTCSDTMAVVWCLARKIGGLCLRAQGLWHPGDLVGDEGARLVRRELVGVLAPERKRRLRPAVALPRDRRSSTPSTCWRPYIWATGGLECQ